MEHPDRPAATSVPATAVSPDPAHPQLVVGHDGHPAGDTALRVAIGLARMLAAEVHVVHSVTVADFGVDPDITEFDEALDRNLGQEREHIAAVLADAPVPWTYHQERGDPADCLARLAEQVGAPFIVVGTSHRGVLRHLIDTPVSQRLLRLQRIPVLVVPADAPCDPFVS